ncbi:branched-chain-amino-acid transaminase bat2, partial [Coemansia sp. RSA 2322]
MSLCGRHLRTLHGTSRLAAAGSKVNMGSEFRAAALQKTLTTTPKALVPKEKLAFGHTFSDHMLTAEWTAKDGWGTPQIRAYGPLSLDPSCSVFHYAFECFEGFKAYRDAQGQ